ncbi:saccharopine dehydrogenase [Spirillospora sp. NPDC050679]
MTRPPVLWMRHETRADEQRAPIVPDDARRLVADGTAVVVEESPTRVFPTADYVRAGCDTAEPGSWVDAAPDTVIVGLKELPDEPAELRHRHVFFGHAYKGQPDGPRLLRRFRAGGGELLDLESLTDAHGRRLAAFGYWAGYAGAALAVLQARGALDSPLRTTTKDALHRALRASGTAPTVLVIGALGRCGQGARDALTAAGLDPTCWDLPETRRLDRRALLDHEIVVNTVFQTGPADPFLTRADLAAARRTRLVCDVTCDVGNDSNALPIYDALTDWRRPVRRLWQDPPLDLIAIDNLPSLLPRESSTAFSAALLPHLATLNDPASPWRSCLRSFHQACRSLDDMEAAHD